jgi:ribonuclease BN (tRNA processing enzyme)
VKLTVVGCAGSYPTPDAAGSCYLIEHEGQSIVLDLGSGSLGPLQQYLDPVLDDGFCGVVLSHCHVDHCSDVADLYVMRHYWPTPPGRRLPLLGPADTRARIAAIYGMPDQAMVDEEYDVRLLTETTTLGPFELRVIPALHPVEAYSIRVTAGGRSLTYSGDTGPNPDLAVLGQGTDIALFESAFTGNEGVVDLHMSGADAGRTAAQAGAGLLVVTHLVAWNGPDRQVHEAAQVFDGPVERAYAGMTISV